ARGRSPRVMSNTRVRDAASEAELAGASSVSEPGIPASRESDKASTDRAVRPLVDRLLARRPDADVALIERAYIVARDAHRDQMRRTGDPYIAHPIGVAMILADLGLDDVTIAGALLHDAVKDTELTLADLVDEFG